MINVGDLAVFLFAVGIVIGFFILLRRALSKADRGENSEDQDPLP